MAAMGECEHSFHREEHEVTYWMYACLRCGKTELEIVRAQLASVTKELEEARAGWKQTALELDGYHEGGVPQRGTRIWRCEHELAKARAEATEVTRKLATAVEALEWIEQENVAAPSTSRGHRWRARARLALAAIRAPEEKSFDSLLSRSSLGTPESMAVRAMASKAAVDKVLRRVDELDRAAEERPECTCKPYEPADNPNCPAARSYRQVRPQRIRKGVRQCLLCFREAQQHACFCCDCYVYYTRSVCGCTEHGASEKP